jgi:hypothetical protein
MLATIFLINSDPGRYNLLICKVWNNNAMRGSNSYPANLERALSMLENWKGGHRNAGTNGSAAGVA